MCKIYNVRIALATCAHNKPVQQAAKKSVVEGLRFYSRTYCVEVCSSRNPGSVLSLILASGHMHPATASARMF